MKKPSLYYSLLAGLLVLTTASCGKKDVDKIGEAQACLDTANKNTASACMDKVAGMESAQSYVIRCAATFIEAEFDSPTKISTAYDNMNGSGAAAGTSVSAMNALSFSSGTLAADTNLNYCTKSNSKGLIMLSGIANMATHLLAFSTCATAGSLTTACISAAASDGNAQSAVGAAAVAAYNSSCTSGQTTNQQFCDQFQSAVTASGGTSNSSCLGGKLLTIYGGGSPTSGCP